MSLPQELSNDYIGSTLDSSTFRHLDNLYICNCWPARCFAASSLAFRMISDTSSQASYFPS